MIGRLPQVDRRLAIRRTAGAWSEPWRTRAVGGMIEICFEICSAERLARHPM